MFADVHLLNTLSKAHLERLIQVTCQDQEGTWGSGVIMLYALTADLCLIWLPRTATSSKMVSTALRTWPWSTVTVACSWTAFVSSSKVMPWGLPAAFQDAQPAASAMDVVTRSTLRNRCSEVSSYQ